MRSFVRRSVQTVIITGGLAAIALELAGAAAVAVAMVSAVAAPVAPARSAGRRPPRPSTLTEVPTQRTAHPES